ncbi:hypothetical protein VTJ83DRAFT_898 [Remersonia thermophila]|uniref:SnoaL-like domain-containing protein n=1 Tax=Remersonia thermophila TaxID=72144 RepID=A0ABR4DMS8_9PEZI
MHSLFSHFQPPTTTPSSHIQPQQEQQQPQEASQSHHPDDYDHPPLPYRTQQPPPLSPTREELLHAAQAFCNAFAASTPTGTLLSNHFTRRRRNILVHEHGLAQLAPFLGRQFRGPEGLDQYLSVMAECVSHEGMRFTDYAVDAEARRVGVRGQARFTWKNTGQVWDEDFYYVLGFDGEARVEKYEIWADSGAAWLASRGEL